MVYNHSSSDEETPSKGRNLAGRMRQRRGRNTQDSSDEEDHPKSSESNPPELQHPAASSFDATMSSQEEPPSQTQTNNGHLILEDPDPNTLRILVSTDNHLGYAENDNVRGNDSFAALEEVLYLAKQYSCDMVMLAGDLFHENRPSRRTLYKTST